MLLKQLVEVRVQVSVDLLDHEVQRLEVQRLPPRLDLLARQALKVDVDPHVELHYLRGTEELQRRRPDDLEVGERREQHLVLAGILRQPRHVCSSVHLPNIDLQQDRQVASSVEVVEGNSLLEGGGHEGWLHCPLEAVLVRPEEEVRKSHGIQPAVDFALDGELAELGKLHNAGGDHPDRCDVLHASDSLRAHVLLPLVHFLMQKFPDRGVVQVVHGACVEPEPDELLFRQLRQLTHGLFLQVRH
mmetsp:Transcript_16210/g.54337  ORF Transcript_16210/g.54337 Transcript_16210/m.54337 type:complete len:245 (-) Transcript_16210:1239-1973(-)